MKKLLYPLAFTLTAFLILNSCSAEEEDTTPPPQVQQPTPEPEPEVTQFTLTITAGEGGTVSTEGGTYDEGTEVTITATPAEGHEFVGWEGNDSDSSSLNVTLNGNTTVQALFSEISNELPDPVDFYSVTKDTIIIPFGTATYPRNNSTQFDGSAAPGTFTYDYQGKTYLFITGMVCQGGECSDATEALDVEPNPSLIFVKEENEWKLSKVLEDVKTWIIRNYQIRDNYIVIGDGNELGYGARWGGNGYIGEINSPNVSWTKFTNNNTLAFMHDIGVGDFNQDGLMDVITGPGRDISDPDRCRDISCNPGPDERIYNFYFQQSNGLFELQEPHTVIEYTQNNEFAFDVNDDSQNFGAGYFSLEVEDIDNDGIDEIIASGYKTVVFKYNEEINKYKLHWYTDQNLDFNNNYTPGDSNMITGEGILSKDINNDGNLDLLLEQVAGPGDGQPSQRTRGIFIYLGNGDGTFSPNQWIPLTFEDLWSTQFIVEDVNNDTFPDFVWKSSDGYWTSNGEITNPVPDNLAFDYVKGFILNELIWMNDGTGYFSQYDDKLLYIPDVYSPQLIPYVKDGKLHILGLRDIDFQNDGALLTQFTDITLEL